MHRPSHVRDLSPARDWLGNVYDPAFLIHNLLSASVAQCSCSAGEPKPRGPGYADVRKVTGRGSRRSGRYARCWRSITSGGVDQTSVRDGTSSRCRPTPVPTLRSLVYWNLAGQDTNRFPGVPQYDAYAARPQKETIMDWIEEETHVLLEEPLLKPSKRVNTDVILAPRLVSNDIIRWDSR